MNTNTENIGGNNIATPNKRSTKLTVALDKTQLHPFILKIIDDEASKGYSQPSLVTTTQTYVFDMAISGLPLSDSSESYEQHRDAILSKTKLANARAESVFSSSEVVDKFDQVGIPFFDFFNALSEKDKSVMKSKMKKYTDNKYQITKFYPTPKTDNGKSS